MPRPRGITPHKLVAPHIRSWSRCAGQQGAFFLLNYGRMIENCTQTTRAYETRPALILVVIQFKNGSQGETQTHMLNCVKVASYQSTFTWLLRETESNRPARLMRPLSNHYSIPRLYKSLNKGNGRHIRRKRYTDGKSYELPLWVEQRTNPYKGFVLPLNYRSIWNWFWRMLTGRQSGQGGGIRTPDRRSLTARNAFQVRPITKLS